MGMNVNRNFRLQIPDWMKNGETTPKPDYTPQPLTLEPIPEKQPGNMQPIVRPRVPQNPQKSLQDILNALDNKSGFEG